MNITKHNKPYTNDDIIDWESAKWDFENTKCSFNKIAKKYSTYAMNVLRKSKEEGWVKFKHNAKEVQAAIAKFDEKQASTNKPTAMLGTVGVRKVQEIVKELGINYSVVDEPLVIAYAESYERYLKLAEEVNTQGEVLISPKTGGEYLSPKFNAMQSVKNDLIKFGNQLGLSIAARKRLSLSFGDNEEAESIFDMVKTLSTSNTDEVII